MKTHRLKVWKQFYQDEVDRNKNFQIRQNDRGYQVGDRLELVEVDEYHNLEETGRSFVAEVTYIYRGTRNNAFWLKDGFVVMSTNILTISDRDINQALE